MSANPPKYSDREIQLLWALIHDAANLDSARDLLKTKGLPSSASSWSSLYQERVRPAITAGTLDGADLIALLREHEEYGRQSVFLYRCSPVVARRLLAGGILRAIGQREDLNAVMKRPLVRDKPKVAEIVDLRLEPNEAGEAFVIKVVATREYRRQIAERVQDGQLVVVYEQQFERAVHLFRLHANGLLELRIQSLSAGNYRRDQAMMWELVRDLLPFNDFETVPLSKVKHNLWQRRAKLVGKMRFRQLLIRNAAGTVVTVTTGSPDDDLAADSRAVRGVAVLLDGDAYLEEVNLRWLASGARTLPARDVQMILGGEINQFSLPARCSKEDYNYVLSSLAAQNG